MCDWIFEHAKYTMCHISEANASEILEKPCYWSTLVILDNRVVDHEQTIGGNKKPL